MLGSLRVGLILDHAYDSTARFDCAHFECAVSDCVNLSSAIILGCKTVSR